jgi:hypothetical protein
MSIKLPKEIWKKKLDFAQTHDEFLMILDQVEEFDTHGDFEWRLKRCRQLLTQRNRPHVNNACSILTHYLISVAMGSEHSAEKVYKEHIQYGESRISE